MRATVIIVAVEIPTVTVDELCRKLDTGDSFVLVDALAPMVYAHSHLPGAINLPPVGLDPEQVLRRIPDRHAEIIVYCTSPDCDDSIQTARRLQALGYTNVRRYAGGKNEWRDEGLPLERAGRPFVPRDLAHRALEEPPGRRPQG
jgi:rhodanese-related sulfurtransferase